MLTLLGVGLLADPADGMAAEAERGPAGRVVAAPTAAQVAWAMDVLQRYLDHPAPAAPAVASAVAGGPAQAVLAGRLQDGGPPAVAGPVPEPPPALRVNGTLQAHDLTAIAIPPDFAGDVISVGGGITVPAGLSSPRITVTDFTPELIDVPVYSLRATFVGGVHPVMVTVCEAGPGCDDAADPDASGIAEVAKLRTTEGVNIFPGGLRVLGSYSWHGSGGTGFFEVPSAVNVNVDNNFSDCFGRPAIGVRLWETDANQIGIQIRCSR